MGSGKMGKQQYSLISRKFMTKSTERRFGKLENMEIQERMLVFLKND